jgi:rhodanese-related sulfurtransferase
MFKKLIIALFIAALACTAFAADEDVIGANVKKFVKTQKEKAPKITPAELKALIEGKQDFILLDVRTTEENAAVKIYADQYEYYPRGVVEFYFTKKVKDPKKHIIVYCKADSRGAVVTNRLIELGYENVQNLEGGIKAWMAAGYEVENSMGTFKEVQF